MCDPPIGTMEREYEVAITIFSIVRRLPQINQTAGDNTHWGGVRPCWGWVLALESATNTNKNQTKEAGGLRNPICKPHGSELSHITTWLLAMLSRPMLAL